MCLETGYSILHKLNTCKSQKVLIFGLKLANTCVLPLALACTLYAVVSEAYHDWSGGYFFVWAQFSRELARLYEY